jgi:hypothetical protein
MSISIPTQPLIQRRDAYSLDIRAAVAGLNGKGGNWTVIGSAFSQIQSSVNRMEKALRESANNTFGEIIVRDSSGKLIGWIGSRAPYFGAWFQQLYVGAEGPDTAPFFADINGDVIIGKNGSLALQDGGGNEVGWLGVQADSAKAITGATNATPIVITCNAHGYENGDTVFIASVGGNTAANGYRIVQGVTPNTFQLTTLAGVNVAGSGAYTSGGTSTRYFGGGRFQTMAVGSSFTSYKIRAYADGQLKIKDALITLTDATNNGYIELNPSTGPDAIFRNTFTGYQVEIVGGVLDLRNYLFPDGTVSIDFSGYRQFNSTLDSIIALSDAAGAGQVNISDASGSGTIGLAGATGKIDAFIVDASTEYRIAGVPGIDNSITVPTGFSFTSANAITSVDFGASTTTSASFIQTITYTDVTITHGKGILTSAV